MEDHTKHLFDAAAIAGLFANFIGWLPNIALTLTIIWTAIRIFETVSVQRFIAWLARKEPKEPVPIEDEEKEPQ